MDPATIATVVGAGASILGDVFGQKKPKRDKLADWINVRNLEMAEDTHQRQWALADRQQGLAERQYDEQFNSLIQARVRDAEAAGVHPLFALGASSNLGGSVSMPSGGQASYVDPIIPGQSSRGSALADGVSRAAGMVAAEQYRAEAAEREKALFEVEVFERMARAREAMAGARRDDVETIAALSGTARAAQRELQGSRGVTPEKLERVMGIEMPSTHAQRKQDAGGEVLGEMDTLVEWFKRLWKSHTQPKRQSPAWRNFGQSPFPGG